MQVGKRKFFGSDPKKAEEARIEAQRQKFILYKQVFGTPQGKEVIIDLMDKFFILNPLPSGTEWERGVAEGKRQCALFVVSQVNMDLAALDKIIKGDQ